MLINRSRIRTFAGASLLVTAAMFATACQNSDDTSSGSGDSSASAEATADAGKDNASGSEAGSSEGKDKGSQDGSGADTGNGERDKVGQTCGANDISWSTRSETQAGGYILVIAKAKPGITCTLPAALPTIAFGSDGTQAGPAEQAVGPAITLGKGTTAYAGVNPKTTKENGGKELDSIIVGVGDADPNPVSLPVGTITVDEPIVTNWHTSAADAVPFGGTDQ
ncbi:DUF4232 domain-containing protein [Streptomyces rapamycinicus]|uniref:DUF4232 domain-containing protein n=2 Tax=Streptomyces rapamycinicus TaxID=1226757 RepID=A0A0A0NJT5_STRRN|nr:DUF4232 domain-containing protein [Streptomyces rapamycinicus]AGP56363.1 hypothetical protein M271_24345 [Streptomyces rapamycinicus NRRL 5491]MBB4783961.1 hypothetical protein [Streptomyces rapamycinicus]RLV80553.1 hypothetical protein D3C57_119250 [Streptomyces rapamycinicus NRRL 5491]UTO64317.1 DUF4232 domain-containing protein [Streptomyces rapamycinicus]UTP32272.1 DUF4232 domain-containing protein [Streptomyces rapamycinicus NRRL 5491]